MDTTANKYCNYDQGYRTHLLNYGLVVLLFETSKVLPLVLLKELPAVPIKSWIIALMWAEDCELRK